MSEETDICVMVFFVKFLLTGSLILLCTRRTVHERGLAKVDKLSCGTDNDERTREIISVCRELYFKTVDKIVPSVGDYFRECDQHPWWLSLGLGCKIFKLFIH